MFLSCIAEMAQVYLINSDVDNTHRAKLLQERSLEALVTRGPREYWQIHHVWLERYVLNLFVRAIYMITHLYLFFDMQVEVGWAFTFHASS